MKRRPNNLHVAAATIKPPYEFTLFTAPEELRRTKTLSGVVMNTGNVAWDEHYKVGARYFRDVNGVKIEGVELRAPRIKSWIAPGERLAFEIKLESDQLPRSAVKCTLDVVQEHVAWLSERGGIPLDVQLQSKALRHFDAWLDVLTEAERKLPDASVRKVRTLRATLLLCDLTGQANRLRETLDAMANGQPYCPLRVSSELLASKLRFPTEAGEAQELFLAHFARVRNLRWSADRPEDSLTLLKKLVDEGSVYFRGATVPIPEAVCKHANKRALPLSVARSPASLLTVALMNEGDRFDINPRDGGFEQIWHFVTSYLIGRGLPQSLAPERIIDVITRCGYEPQTTGEFPVTNAFLNRLYADDTVYKTLYNLDLEWSRLAFALDMFILGLENEGRRLCVGPEMTEWLTAPLAKDMSLCVLELAFLVLTDRPAVRIEPGMVGEGLAQLRRAVSWLNAEDVPQATPCVRLLGDYETQTGLSVNLGMSKQALESIPCAVEIVDTRSDKILPASAGERATFKLSRPVDIFHLNLDAVPTLVARYADVARHDTYRIAFALWESSIMPEQHEIGMRMVDEIWAPTEYVANVYRAAGHTNVHVVGKGISLPATQPFDLARIGVPRGVTTFLVSFDMHSWVERKNPMAAVEAFQRAFPGDHDVRLVMKSTGLMSHPGDRTNQAGRIEAASENDPRIVLLSKRLKFAEYLGLIESVDATVSPHRSEGFGYSPAYSLLLGVPAIVTDYSGTTDFCTPETSFPVAAKPRLIRPGEFVYDTPNAEWADIDIDDLARAMLQVRDNPQEARRRAAQGRIATSKRYSLARLSERYAERLRAI